jgi:hypothetical protein
MAEVQRHSEYGDVSVLQRSRLLVRIETTNGDMFWVTAASFTKKKAKPRAKKKKVVHKLDEPGIDALLVRVTRAEESEPEVFDAVEEIVQESELEEENEEAEDVA